jgi:hypothetical protein
MRRALSLLVLTLSLVCAGTAHAQTLSIVGIADQPIVLDVATIEALGTTEITDSREVSGATGTDRISIVYRGMELAKLLEAQGIARLDRNGLRAASIVITAKDGYRASFSWGELFITSGGSRVLLITGENGRANPAREGAFSLRAFADLRPGPRHVRDVSEIRVVLPR